MNDDPLSDHAHRLRRNLLLIAAIAVAVYIFNIEITQFTTLGIQKLDPRVVPIILLSLLVYHLIQFGWTGSLDLQGWSVHRRVERDNVLTASSDFSTLTNAVSDSHSLDQLEAFLGDEGMAGHVSASYRSQLDKVVTALKHELGVKRRAWILDFSMPFAFAAIAAILELLSIFGVPAKGWIAPFSGATPV